MNVVRYQAKHNFDLRSHFGIAKTRQRNRLELANFQANALRQEKRNVPYQLLRLVGCLHVKEKPYSNLR